MSSKAGKESWHFEDPGFLSYVQKALDDHSFRRELRIAGLTDSDKELLRSVTDTDWELQSRAANDTLRGTRLSQRQVEALKGLTDADFDRLGRLRNELGAQACFCNYA
jgi:hypothetical protein